MVDRRKRPSATNAQGYLQQLPALQLLNRLPTAILGVGLLGNIDYANPASAAMFGYPDGETVTRLRLPELLTGHEAVAAADCLDTLRTDLSAVEWNHSQGYVIRTMISPPLLLRDTDAVLLFGVTDVTAWHWDTGRQVHARRTNGQSVP
jgi:transcriptional regulator of aromatic amino acid metabolism